MANDETERAVIMKAAPPGWYRYGAACGPRPTSEIPSELREVGKLRVVDVTHAGAYRLFVCDSDGSYWATRL
jgi:hypothetical protein